MRLAALITICRSFLWCLLCFFKSQRPRIIYVYFTFHHHLVPRVCLKVYLLAVRTLLWARRGLLTCP